MTTTSAVLAALLLAGCERETPAPDGAPAPAQNPGPAAPTTLGRADIVAALALAASAHAAGAEPGDAATIAGRTFSIRLPFGCFGPAGEPGSQGLSGEGLASWRWDEDRRGQVLTLTPADWTRSDDLLAPGAEPDWERVDGYWIARPWLSEETCPAPAPPRPQPEREAEAAERDEPAAETPPARPAPAPFTAGLAAIRTEEASRLGRGDGEPYRFVVRGEGEAPPPVPRGGYRVVLEGRIGAFPDGHPVRCSSEGPNSRPVCIAAIVLDRVAFETADGQQLSEWRPEG